MPTRADVLPRIVDGRRVELTNAEKDAKLAEWAAEDARRAAEEQPPVVVPPPPPPRPLTRDEKVAIHEKEEFGLALGPVLHILISELRARGTTATLEAEALFAKIDAIQALFASDGRSR